MKKIEQHIWESLRLLLGFVFLWSFLDKTFGLGFATTLENAWIAGGSPTYGYLMFATSGPFAGIFQSLASSVLVEWLFMLGVLFVGLTLLSGIMVRLGALVGMVFYTLFYISGFLPPEHNPIVDEHVINFVLMLGIFVLVPHQYISLGQWWATQSWSQKFWLMR